MIAITPLYAAPLALLTVVLALRVIGERRRGRVALGTGPADAPGADALLRAVRAHGNCVETAPLGLVLMLGAEAAGAPGWSVHAAGVLLLAGRLLHARGVSRAPEDFRLRVSGMSLTFAALGVAAVAGFGAALAG